MIETLSLENWKSHSLSEFRFGKGTNILIGRMGSGKSSVLDALCFALYGTFPKMSRRDQAVEHLVNAASGAPYALVAVEFGKGGAEYRVERRIGKKISEADVRMNGKLAQKGPKAVTDYVTNALGVDYELFTRAIYSEQNRIDYLLSLNPRARKQEIDWLLGLGQFDSAREAAQAVAGKLSEQSELLAADAKPERMEQAKRKAGETASQKKEKLSSCEKMADEKAELDAKVAGAQEAVSSLGKTQLEWKKLQSACEQLRGAAKRLSEETKGKGRPGKDELSALAGSRKRAEEKLAEKRKAAREKLSQLSAIRSEIAVLESRKKTSEQQKKRKAWLEAKVQKIAGKAGREKIAGELADQKKRLEELMGSHAKLHAQAGELSSAAAALAGAGAKCPVCDSDLSGGRAGKLSQEKKQSADELREQEKKLAEVIGQCKTAIASLEENLSGLDVCLAELSRLTAEEDAAALEKLSAEKAMERVAQEKECEKAEQEAGAAEKLLEAARKEHEEAGEAAKLFAGMDETAARLKEAEGALSKLGFDEALYEERRKAAETLRVSQAALEAKLGGERRQLELLQQMLSLEEKEIASLSEKAALAEKYAKAAEGMLIYKNGLAAVQSELRNVLVDEINQALCEIWPSVYPYGDYSAVKIEADERDYRLLMEKNGWNEVDAVASGGERACLCLALRIAFATVLTPDIGWLILDEPTHNLDADAVSLLSEAINEKIPSIVEQTFVITHDISLGETGQGAVFRLERDKAKNEATRVEQL